MLCPVNIPDGVAARSHIAVVVEVQTPVDCLCDDVPPYLYSASCLVMSSLLPFKIPCDYLSSLAGLCYVTVFDYR